MRPSVCVFLALFLALLPVTGARAQASRSPLEDLAQLFRVDMPSADVVLLLDGSGSMSTPFEPGERQSRLDVVRQATTSFVPSLTEKENLHLRLFASTVIQPLEGSGREVAARVEGYLPKRPLPGEGTDIGLAVAKGLEYMEREGAPRVQALFLLTDGFNQPRPGSPFPADFQGPNWQDLARRARAHCRDHTVFVYGFGIGEERGIDLLRQVFPPERVELVVGSAAEVARVLRRVRDGIRRAQLREALAQELREGSVEARAGPPAGPGSGRTTRVPVTIHNGYGHLPVRLEAARLDPAGPPDSEMQVTMEGATGGTVVAGGQESRCRIEARVTREPPRWRLGVAEAEHRATLRIVPVARFQHAAALKELGMAGAPRVVEAAVPLDLRIRSGIPFWVAAGLLLALIADAAGVLFYRRRRPPLRFAGHLTRSGDRNEAVDLGRYAEESEVTIGPQCNIEVAPRGAPRGGPLARLRMVEEGGCSRLQIEGASADVRVNQQAIEGAQRLNPGDLLRVGPASLVVGDDVEKRLPPATRPLLLIAGLVLTVLFTYLLFTAHG